MPNLPASVLHGVAAIVYPNSFKNTDKEWVNIILSSVGGIVELEEKYIDAVTAVSGSGPGYFFWILQQWIEAAKQHLPIDVATKLAIETFIGTAELLKIPENQDLALMISKVATPGGTTQAAIDSLNNDGVTAILSKAVTASTNRAHEFDIK